MKPVKGNNLLDTYGQGEQDTPACHPGRLWSLWDIMNVYDTAALSFVLGELQVVSGGALIAQITGGGGKPPSETIKTRAAKALEYANALFNHHTLEECADHVETARGYYNRSGLDISTLIVVFQDLEGHILKALTRATFVKVEDDRRKYVNSQRLFGDAVFDAFKSARQDIEDAGNCLAAECSTAAVFHLMRVAEVGLRALAYDREAHVFKNAKTLFEIPLELASWDQLIRELEDAEKAIQGYPQTMARERQFDFYHGAMMQYRAFKNVFRNNIMHTRDSYDRDEAISVYNKVKEFMEILAMHIKEDERTPTIWA